MNERTSLCVAGIDIGSFATKAVILRNNHFQHHRVIVSAERAEVAAREVLAQTLAEARLRWEDLDYVVTTGVIKDAIPFAQGRKSLVMSLGKGAYGFFPQARTVIDAGAENVTVVNLDEKGRVQLFVDNDKCAAGSGAFLESIAKLLKMPLEDMAQEALTAGKAVEISNTCTIFAEQEIISRSYEVPSVPLNEILLGLHEALAARIIGLVKKVRIVPEVMFCGGVAKNAAFVRSLEKRLKMRLLIPENPLIVAASGAALFAREALEARIGSLDQ